MIVLRSCLDSLGGKAGADIDSFEEPLPCALRSLLLKNSQKNKNVERFASWGFQEAMQSRKKHFYPCP